MSVEEKIKAWIRSNKIESITEFNVAMTERQDEYYDFINIIDDVGYHDPMDIDEVFQVTDGVNRDMHIQVWVNENNDKYLSFLRCSDSQDSFIALTPEIIDILIGKLQQVKEAMEYETIDNQ